MARYVIVRMTVEQAQAAANACDLIRDEYDASGEHKREAGLYQRAGERLQRALSRKDKP